MPTLSKDDVSEFMKQRRKMYENSRPHLTDVGKVREELTRLIDQRLQEGVIDRNQAARTYTYLCSHFPKILDCVLSYKQERLGEAKEIFGKMLNQLEAVQAGKSVVEASDQIEEELGKRFYRPDVKGRYNSLGTFIIPSGNQESLSGTGTTALDCYHTKLYTVDTDGDFDLNRGLQTGQIKKFTFVFKGTEGSKAIVNVPDLIGTQTKIEFTEVGDTAELMWDGGKWVVLLTLNITNPESQTPVVM